jgi:hypothetical protein
VLKPGAAGDQETDMSYIARKYRYADGNAYRQNLYVIYEADGIRAVGGAVVLKDKAIAFAGHSGLCQEKIGSIIAHAKAFAWGSDLKDALTKIKPELKGH